MDSSCLPLSLSSVLIERENEWNLTWLYFLDRQYSNVSVAPKLEWHKAQFYMDAWDLNWGTKCKSGRHSPPSAISPWTGSTFSTNSNCGLKVKHVLIWIRKVTSITNVKSSTWHTSQMACNLTSGQKKFLIVYPFHCRYFKKCIKDKYTMHAT